MNAKQTRQVTLACQGGGSHNGFTAGVLEYLLENLPQDHQFIALSGTSGGAVCATLAWEALQSPDPVAAAGSLRDFWEDNAASGLWDSLVNRGLVTYAQLMSFISLPVMSPYYLPTWGQEQLRALLERHIPFAKFANPDPSRPLLVVGAVDVLSGEFKVFRSADGEITVEALLASAAIPELFRAVDVKGRLYWDGLFSQNPPLQELAHLHPDEIWIIQINPNERREEPRTLDEIRDRRNELSGNLSLNQEIRQIELINRLLREGVLQGSPYRPITVRTIALDRNYNYTSKLDRDPYFLRELMSRGREQAKKFLDNLNSEEHFEGSRELSVW